MVATRSSPPQATHSWPMMPQTSLQSKAEAGPSRIGIAEVANCSETLGWGPGPGRDAVDVRHHIHHRRLTRGHGLVEGALNLAGMVHANAEATHVLCQL